MKLSIQRSRGGATFVAAAVFALFTLTCPAMAQDDHIAAIEAALEAPSSAAPLSSGVVSPAPDAVAFAGEETPTPLLATTQPAAFDAPAVEPASAVAPEPAPAAETAAAPTPAPAPVETPPHDTAAPADITPPAVAPAPAPAAPPQTLPPRTIVVDAPAAAEASPASLGDRADPASAGYVLGARDRIRLIVFGEPNLSGEFVVDSIGRVSMPLVGEIQAQGLNVRAFERAVEDLLRGGYLQDPHVSVEVMNYRPFYILGEVARPGEYPYTQGLTVFNAVAMSGGFTPLANQIRILIRRAGQSVEENLDLTAAATVGPGDTIRVVKGAIYILGEVNRPGEYPFSAGMTVANAVASAGGFSYRANKNRVWIKKQGEEQELEFKVTPNLTINPGDTIRVGERFF